MTGQASARALSPREREVLGLLGDGLAVSDIATRLALSVKTVEAITVRVRTKVGCVDMAALRRFAVIRRRQELTAHLLSRSVPILHHATLDHEHNEMLRLISRIEREQDEAAGLPAACDELLACARFHVEGEEALMRSSRFPAWQAHAAEHQRFIAELEGFRTRLGGHEGMASFQTFAAHWLGHHIDTWDRRLVAYLAGLAPMEGGGGPPAPPSVAAVPASVIDPAFLDRAIQSHLRWKIRLYSIIADRDAAALDRPLLCADGHCDLGRWIHGDGRGLADLDLFQALQESHRRFHASVGAICDLVVAGRFPEAQAELHAGEFYHWSAEVVRQITTLRAALVFPGP
jgi:hemerythrin-like metal-binding protein